MFLNARTLTPFFNANHEPFSNTNIAFLYLDINKIFMKHFKKKPENIIEILT